MKTPLRRKYLLYVDTARNYIDRGRGAVRIDARRPPNPHLFIYLFFRFDFSPIAIPAQEYNIIIFYYHRVHPECHSIYCIL